MSMKIRGIQEESPSRPLILINNNRYGQTDFAAAAECASAVSLIRGIQEAQQPSRPLTLITSSRYGTYLSRQILRRLPECASAVLQTQGIQEEQQPSRPLIVINDKRFATDSQVHRRLLLDFS
uniref:Uncharacterized protein n=1 Tax=Tetradesmus obliquus TaxID=3088 RepID=A0A383WJ39_TETOB|eukprot:jgi/Sobl393_1/12247/SZX77485.1